MAHPLTDEFKTKSGEALQAFKKEVSGIRANRPTTALVENLKVECYGQQMAMNAVGNISIQLPRTVQIQVWDASIVTNVVKAIETSTLHLTANVDGNNIRINLPELSAERREELNKHVKRIAEDHRITIRHLRDEANKRIQRALDDNEIHEDQKFKLKEEIQKQTDAINSDLEKTLEGKIKEINE